MICYGKGLNKQETKKAAAKHALKIVAPVIYKEVFGDEPAGSGDEEMK